MVTLAVQRDRIGPYRVLEVVGSGGMGVVYKAAHVETGELAAVKTVRLPHPSRLAGLRAEILALCRVQHPGVVRILGHGVDEGWPWYAMELLRGRTLAGFRSELWGREEALERPPVAAARLEEVLGLVRRLCEPLAWLHAEALVHRDLKPSNIFLTEDGRMVLMDFGLVCRFRDAVGRETLEFDGRGVGTLAYMAPEQIRGEVVDARADLYALGCILFELLTGRPPFASPTPAGLVSNQLTSAVPRLATFVHGAPAALEDLVQRLLAKAPRARFGFAEDVALALDELGALVPAARDEISPAAVAAHRSYLYRPEMAGRDEARAQLEESVERVRAGRGACILIGGESGVGKTMLASEVARAAARREVIVIAGECLPVGTDDRRGLGVHDAPLHPFRAFFETVADLCRSQGSAVTDRLLGDRGAVLAEHAPTLTGLPGAEQWTAPCEIPAEEARSRVYSALADTLSAFAREAPLLLVLDDLQWADELTLGFLESRPPEFFAGQRLLLVGTFRSEELGPVLRALLARDSVSRLDLCRLNDANVKDVVSGMLAMELPPETFVDVVARLSEGNPFYVAEYLRTAVAEQLLFRERGAWRVKNADHQDERAYQSLSTPVSIRELGLRRLARLPQASRQLAEVAAVLGREMEMDFLLSHASMADEAALDALQALVGAQVLEAGNGDVRFVHDKLRETTYSQISPARRQQLHAKVAEALEARSPPPPFSTLAYHHRGAESWAKAIDYFEKAGERALCDFANREAEAFFSNAFELACRLPEDIDRLRLGRWEARLTEATISRGAQKEARAHAAAALAHFGHPMPNSKRGIASGFLLQIPARIFDAYAPRTLAIAPGARESVREAVNVYARLFDFFLYQNEMVLGHYCGLRAINLGERLGEPSPAVARAYALISASLGLTPLASLSTTWAARSLSYCEQIGDGTTTAYCLTRTGVLEFFAGRWEEGHRKLDRAEAVGEEIGNRRAVNEALAAGATGYQTEGRFEDAATMHRRLAVSAKQRGDLQALTWARALRALALVKLGRDAEALDLSSEGKGWVDASGTNTEKVLFYSALAVAKLHTGKPDEAGKAASEALDVMMADRFLLWMFGIAIEALFEVFETQKLDGRLRDTVAMAAEFAKLYPLGKPLVANLRGRRALALGAMKTAEKSFFHALAEAEKLGMLHDEAVAHAGLARLSRRDRHEHRSRARDLFIRMGCAPAVRSLELP